MVWICLFVAILPLDSGGSIPWAFLRWSARCVLPEFLTNSVTFRSCPGLQWTHRQLGIPGFRNVSSCLSFGWTACAQVYKLLLLELKVHFFKNKCVWKVLSLRFGMDTVNRVGVESSIISVVLSRMLLMSSGVESVISLATVTQWSEQERGLSRTRKFFHWDPWTSSPIRSCRLERGAQWDEKIFYWVHGPSGLSGLIRSCRSDRPF